MAAISRGRSPTRSSFADVNGICHNVSWPPWSGDPKGSWPTSYAVTIRSDFGPPTKLGGLLDACPLFATNLRGNLLAAAWDKGGKVDLKVFELVSPDLQLVWALMSSGRLACMVMPIGRGRIRSFRCASRAMTYLRRFGRA